MARSVGSSAALLALIAIAAISAASLGFATLNCGGVSSHHGRTSSSTAKKLASISIRDSIESDSAADGEPASWFAQAVRWAGAGLVAGLLAAALSASPADAYTSAYSSWKNPAKDFDLFNLTLDSRTNEHYWQQLEPCKKNKKFAKRMKDSKFKIESKQKKYPKDSVVFNRYTEKLAKLEKRQVAYGDRLCGKKDGLPRVMVDPRVKSGGVVIPSLIFLYIAGWIGWAGRTYLLRTQDVQKEINMDVPLALTCMASGFAWPVNAWQAIVNGEMTVKDTEIYKPTF